MSSVLDPLLRPDTPHPDPEEPLLEPGDHMDRRTFHALYSAMPPGTRAELIGGVVYMPSPVRANHSRPHVKVLAWLDTYEAATPGTEAHSEATVFLSEWGEPQPDACLLIAPQHGGQTQLDGGYISGAPELVVEVASSTVSYDLHKKLADYEAAGVREYLVYVVRTHEARWFINRSGTFEEIAAGDDGVIRSEVFPGLWLNLHALSRLDSTALRKTLEEGLASPEHQAFVKKLLERTPS